MKFMIISKKRYNRLINLLKEAIPAMKEALTAIDDLTAQRDYYKKSWEDLQTFCMSFSKDKNIDFPATTKVEKPENKIY